MLVIRMFELLISKVVKIYVFFKFLMHLTVPLSSNLMEAREVVPFHGTHYFRSIHHISVLRAALLTHGTEST